MKKNKLWLGVLAATLVFAMTSAGCDDGTASGSGKTLEGDVTISPSANVTTGTVLTAAYSGSEAVTYQWNKGGTAVKGETGSKFVPPEAGAYTVTASAAGFKSKTSAAVTVKGDPIPDLPGDVTITIYSDYFVHIGTELIANYDNAGWGERYQWNKEGIAVQGATTYYYTPSKAGSYTVTVSAAGFEKTSTAVTVTGVYLPGNVTITPFTDVYTSTELTATYSGSETVSFQWKRNGSNVGTASTTNPNKYTPTEAGTYMVTLSAAGYNSKNSDAVSVTSAITYTASPNNTTGTTAINFTFSTEVTNLTAEDITITDGGGSATKGTLSGSGKNWSLRIIVNATGRIDVSIAKSGIESSIRIIMVYKPIVWTAVTNSTFGSSNIYAIAYGNNKFVAGGDLGKMATSTDGVTWTAVPDSTFGNSTINAIAYGNNKFVAGGSGSGGRSKMAISMDGVTWTPVSNPFATYTIFTIAYGLGMFVAGGQSGKMATSTDGITWTDVPWTMSGSSHIEAIAYGNNNRFVAVCFNGSMRISTDGTTWTDKNSYEIPFGGLPINAIAYDGNKFVAGGSGRMATSTDGITWTAVSHTFGSSSIRAIAYNYYSYYYGYSLFVAGGENGRIATSRDYVTWTSVSDSTFGSSQIEAITYGNNKFVAVGRSGKMAYFLDN